VHFVPPIKRVCLSEDAGVSAKVKDVPALDDYQSPAALEVAHLQPPTEASPTLPVSGASERLSTGRANARIGREAASLNSAPAHLRASPSFGTEVEEPIDLRSNRSARLPGGRMSLDEAE
jgi:hypothetical protein